MLRVEDGSTSPTLLREVADWRNDPAWSRFRGRYDPLLRRWCREYGLDEESIDEVCQRIWIELANRMQTFRYDPDGTFRGWLRRLCTSRVVDFMRQRKTASLLCLDERDEPTRVVEPETALEMMETEDVGDLADRHHLFLIDEARNVQATVRAKVKSPTWEAFWLVAVQDWTVELTANTLGMTRTAVYAARERVARMLNEEGRRVSEHWPAGW